MFKKIVFAIAASVGLTVMVGPAYAQLRPPSGGTTVGDYTLHDFAAKWMVQQDDIAEIGKYRAANELIRRSKSGTRIVFIGDSITELWTPTPRFDDPSLEVVDRGIGGQNTTQMLLRFEDDVVSLDPDIVVILGGTNDVRAYVGDPEAVALNAFERVTRNVTAMADIADGRNIQVVICSLPPVGSDRERIGRSNTVIRNLNVWLENFARGRGYGFANFNAALVDSTGLMPTALSSDGIHPNADGYSRMLKVVSAEISGLTSSAPTKRVSATAKHRRR